MVCPCLPVEMLDGVSHSHVGELLLGLLTILANVIVPGD